MNDKEKALVKEIETLQRQLEVLREDSSNGRDSPFSGASSSRESDDAQPHATGRSGSESATELREALAAERMITQTLREENAALRLQLASLQQRSEAKPQATVPSSLSEPTAGQNKPPPSQELSDPSSLTEPKPTQVAQPKTMASLFANRKPTSVVSGNAAAATASPSASVTPSGSEAPSFLSQEHDRRKSEMLRLLAEDDKRMATAEDPFVTEARKRHLIINRAKDTAAVSSLGFGTGPNPRGYFGGLGGSRGHQTTSNGGEADEVTDLMRRALQDGMMDDRRATLDAEEDAKMAARLKKLQERK